jgi:ribosomal protein S18 acetylase RimI-like enzyme
MDDIAGRALDVNHAQLALGSERFEADGATFTRNRNFPKIPDPNRVIDIRASSEREIEGVLARAEREYAGFPQRRFDVDFRTPPQFDARLAAEGYRRNGILLMALDGEPRGEAMPCDIRPVEDDDTREGYTRLHEVDWEQYVKAGSPPGEWSAEAMVGSRRLKSPPMRYWLAYVDGEPRSYLASWEGIDGVGQIEDLFTHPEHRRRGLATALIHHCVADCRAHGADVVVLAADPEGTAKEMYGSLGFRPVAEYGSYWKIVER